MEIIFEDAHLIVVSKACGETVVFGRNLKEKPLNYLLSEKLGHCVYPVHRLDKETSGVCLFAKDPQTQCRLSSLFEARKIKKTYWALVSGKLEGQGSIDAPLKLFGSGRTGVKRRKAVKHSLPRSSKLPERFSFGAFAPNRKATSNSRPSLFYWTPHLGRFSLWKIRYRGSAADAPRA